MDELPNADTITYYAPVFLQTAPKYFFDRATIPVYSGNVAINLMDYFPLVKRGYALINASGFLALSYTYTHNLRDPTDSFFVPDNLYIEAFGSNIPAFKYEYYDVNGQIPSFLMQDAVNQGIIPESLNTFEVLQGLNYLFNPQRIGAFFGNMMKINSQSMTEVPELSDIVNDKQGSNELINEWMMAWAICEILRVLFRTKGPGSKFSVIDMMIEAVKDERKSAFLNRLLADDRVNKLIYAIIIDDINLVDQYIDLYDPRDNNFEAYHLAVVENKPVIAERIRQAIIQRNILERRTFQTMMAPLGESDIPESQRFYELSRSLANK